MPTFPVRRTSRLLRSDLRQFKWTALAATTTAMGVCVGLFVLNIALEATIILCAGVLTLALRYAYFAYRARQADRQLQLEARFMRQPLHQEPLSACMTSKNSHLWADSYTFHALQRALKLPLPRLMLVEKKLERLKRFFRLAYLPLQMRVWKANLLTALALAVAGIMFLSLSPPDELLRVALAILTGAALLEFVLWRKRQRIRRQLNVFLKGLSRWTLSERQNGTLRDDLRKPYHHELLYHARRWFGDTGGDGSTRRAA